jgi:glycosyltransferase involved in cell wall biosynthesis
MDNFDISVVVPCYNAGRYLRETLESIAAQSVPAADIVLLNDGSTDDSVAVAEAFAATQPEGRVRIISQPNQGIGNARTAAVANAKYERVVTLDADDVLHPNALEWWSAYATAHPQYALIYGDYILMEEDGKVTGEVIHRQRRSDPLEGNILATMLWENVTGACNYLQRDLVLKVGGFAMDRAIFGSDHFQDVILTMRLLLAGYEIGYVQKPVYYYRNTPGSLSKNITVADNTIENVFTYLFQTYPRPMSRAFLQVRTWRAEQLRDSFETLKARDAQISQLEQEIIRARQYQRDMEEVIAHRNRQINEFTHELNTARIYQKSLEDEIRKAAEYQPMLEAEVQKATQYQHQLETEIERARAYQAGLEAELQSHIDLITTLRRGSRSNAGS